MDVVKSGMVLRKVAELSVFQRVRIVSDVLAHCIPSYAIFHDCLSIADALYEQSALGFASLRLF